MGEPKPRIHSSYTAGFKLKVIEYAEKHGNRAAARQWNINEKLARNWRKSKQQLLETSEDRRSFRGPKHGNFPALEKELLVFVHDMQNYGCEVTCDMLQTKAREIARQSNIPPEQFKASYGWLMGFWRRFNKLSETDDRQKQEALKADVMGLLLPASEDETILPTTSASDPLSVSEQDHPVSNRQNEVNAKNEAMQPSVCNDDPTVMPDFLGSEHDPTLIGDSSSSGYNQKTVKRKTYTRKPVDFSELYSCKIRGRRIIDLELFFKTMKELNNHSTSNCDLNDIYITKEQRSGLLSHFEVKCAICKFKGEIWSDDPQSKNKINADAVGGILSICGGFEDLRDFLKELKVPPVAKSLFQEEYKKIRKDLNKEAQQPFKTATERASVAATKQFSRNPDSILNSPLPVRENFVVLDSLAEILIGNQTEGLGKDDGGSCDKPETASKMNVDAQNKNGDKDIQVSADSDGLLKATSLKENMESPVNKRKRIVEKERIEISGVVIKQEIEVDEEMAIESSKNDSETVEHEKFDGVRIFSEHEIKPEPSTTLAESCAVGEKSVVSQQIAKIEAPVNFHGSSCMLEKGKPFSQVKNSDRITPAQETSSFNTEASVGQYEINSNSLTASQAPLTALDSLKNFVQLKVPGQSYAPASLQGMIPSQGVVHPQGIVSLQRVVHPQGIVSVQRVASPQGITHTQGQLLRTDGGLIQCQFNPSNIAAIQGPLVLVGSPVQSTSGIVHQQISVPVVPNPPHVLPSTPSNVRLNVPNNSSPSSSSSFFTLPGGAPKNIPSQAPYKPNSSQSDKQPKRSCFRCEDCDITFAKSESLDTHLKTYCIKRLKIPPSSTVTSRTLENLSLFPVELHLNSAINNVPSETRSCVSALNLAMINKRSALEASVEAASEAQYIISHHNQIQKEKERIFKELNDVISKESVLAPDISEEERCAVVNARLQALSKAQTAFMNEKYAETSVEQALFRQKVAIEAAVLATTQEQTAFLVTMKALKAQLNENKPSTAASFSQKNGSTITSVGPLTNHQSIVMDGSTNAAEMLNRVALDQSCNEKVSFTNQEKNSVRIACYPTTNKEQIAADVSSKATEMLHRLLPDRTFRDELTEKPISPLSQEKSPVEASIELTTMQQKTTDASTKATEILNQVPLDMDVDTLNDKKCEVSISDTVQSTLYWDNARVQQIPNIDVSALENNKYISVSDHFKISSSNKIQENMILSSKFLDESQIPSVFSTPSENTSENILTQEFTDLNRTDLRKNKINFYGINTER